MLDEGGHRPSPHQASYSFSGCTVRQPRACSCFHNCVFPADGGRVKELSGNSNLSVALSPPPPFWRFSPPPCFCFLINPMPLHHLNMGMAGRLQLLISLQAIVWQFFFKARLCQPFRSAGVDGATALHSVGQLFIRIFPLVPLAFLGCPGMERAGLLIPFPVHVCLWGGWKQERQLGACQEGLPSGQRWLQKRT